MTQRAEPEIELYRGFVVHFHDAQETVEEVKNSIGGSYWQSLERLKEALQQKVDEADVVMDYDVAGYVETVKVKRVAERS